MARKRFGRRRPSWILAAVVLSLLVLIFGRDVARTAHGDRAAQISQNESFGALASSTVAQEKAIDTQLHTVLNGARHLTRASVLEQLQQIRNEAVTTSTQVAALIGPGLVSDIAPTFVHDVQRRARAYRSLADVVANALNLPWTPSGTTSTSAALQELAFTQASWARAAQVLAQQPGHVIVAGFPSENGPGIAGALAALRASPTLALVRSASITAVAISPAPLPAAAHHIALIPLTSFQVTVSVSNLAVDRQPVQLVATLVFHDGHQVIRSVRGEIGPSSSLAFHDLSFPVNPGARATLTLRLTGSPPLASGFSERRYQVVIASA